jgi:hypothetical protein
MVAIKISDGLQLKDLQRFYEPVEIHDEDGRVIGVYVPADLQQKRQRVAEMEPPPTTEEIERLMNQPSVPHAIVMDGLRKLEVESQRRRSAGEPDLTPDEAVAYVRSLREASRRQGNPASCATH